eukprot:TRINITY_DN3743_c0_g2_i1.p1 TRINITY_DN3743_c0_g2~~TRINITY_DN3743_c0_g2_i1.p1  ORF type:complete len:264 (-),score=46.10 TRINITY_DN3743_c0_g2_i1:63-854(-)
MSWLAVQLTFDREYKKQKRRFRRNHPETFWQGMSQGGLECIRGILTGVSGVVTQAYGGAQESGVFGFMKGLARGLLGLPLKPLAGVCDFSAKTLEGLLRTMGTSYTVQRRIIEPSAPESSSFSSSSSLVLTHSQMAAIKDWLISIDERFYAHFGAQVRTRRGRLRVRLLVLTDESFHIINLFSISRHDYRPTSVPLQLITEILVPQFPETNFTVVLSKVVFARDRFQFVVPDREILIGHFRDLLGDQGRTVKVKGVDKIQSTL